MAQSLAWFYLMLAIFAEVVGTTSMKLSHGFANLKPSIFIFIFYLLSLIFLSKSLRRLDIGFAYAIWSGVGTLLIFFIGILWFQEPITMLKAFSVFCIIAGVLGLKST